MPDVTSDAHGRGLSDEDLAHFKKHGYVIVRQVLSEADFALLENGYSDLVEEKAKELFDKGAIKSLHSDLPFARRLAAIAEECSDSVFETDLSPWGLSLDTMHARLRGCFDFFFSPRLLSAVESIVGAEITLNPIQHFRPFLPTRKGKQCMVGAASLAPWHQDQGVTREEADDSDIVTCWIPLIDAQTKHGCMEIIPDCTDLGLLEHVKDPELGTTIRPDLLPGRPRISAEMNRGDIIFLHKFTPHRSQPNNSDLVRWSLDCRFQKTGTPTGRHFWPEFILQSKLEPNSVQNSYDDWCRRWKNDLETSKGERWHRVAGDIGGLIGTKHLATGLDAQNFGAERSPKKLKSSS